jgi:predicted alpha-1,2-mannosidase
MSNAIYGLQSLIACPKIVKHQMFRHNGVVMTKMIAVRQLFKPVGANARKPLLSTKMLAMIAAASVLVVGGLATSTSASASTGALATNAIDYSRFVDPFIGTGDATTLTGNAPGSGLVGQGTPAAHLPFGMLQWGPDTNSVTNNSRHYNYADTKLTGFSLHNEFGYEPQMVSFLPYSGDVTTSPGSHLSDYYQTFSHSDESATAGQYSVTSSSHITTDLTATTRAGIASVTFPDGATNSLIINLQDPTGNSNGNNSMSIDPATGIVSGWVGDVSASTDAKGPSRLYFSARFDQPVSTYATFNGDNLNASGTTTNGSATGAVLTFPASTTPVGIRTAVSWVSVSNARSNLAAEIPDSATFLSVAAAAHNTWVHLLARFAVNDPEAKTADLTKFYSALYRTVSAPTTFSDENGDYPGWDGATHNVAAGHTEYNGWASWNGSRTGQMAFLATFFPKEANDVGQSIVDSSLLDNFNHNVSQGTSFFDGDSGDYAQLPELYAFGATNFDAKTGLNMLLQSANQVTNNLVRYGNGNYLANGYVPADTAQPLPTEETQSYAQFDFNTAQLAAKLGSESWADLLMTRSDSWRNVFDPSAKTASTSGYMWGKGADGGFAPGFCPSCGDWTGGTRTDGTTFWEEASSAQSSYWPSYNLAALIRSQGGKKAFVSRLNDFFTKLNDGTHSSNYYQGNEPDVGAPWTYDWAGTPSGTQSTIRRIITSVYLDTPGGMPGNDDWSAESTYQTWAMLGMFPEIPAIGGFALASPLFSNVVITLESGKTFSINGKGAARNAPYVQSASLNGSRYSSPWLHLSRIANGKNNALSFVLGTHATSWGASPTTDAPPSFGNSSLKATSTGTGRTTSFEYRGYDLGSSHAVNGFSVGPSIRGGYRIQTSESRDPKGAWTTVATNTGTKDTTTEYFTKSTDARYVRIIAAEIAFSGTVPELLIHGVTDPLDVVAGRPATSSGGSCSDSNGPDKALDNSDTTKWCINAGSGAAWMDVDLGSTQQVDRFIVKNAGINGESDSTNTVDYQIQSSKTGAADGTWTDLASVSGNTGRVSYSSSKLTTVRYLRLNIPRGQQAAGDNVVRVYGFEAYGPATDAVPDLAAGRPSSSSGGSCTDDSGPSRALDGSDTTKWCINAGGSAAWMDVDLGDVQSVDRFVLKNASSGGESGDTNTANYKIQYSATGDPDGDWTDLVTVSGNTDGISYTSSAPTQARYIRLLVTKGIQGEGDNVARIYGFEVYPPA